MAAKMSEKSDLRNFFGKRNEETDQEPSSSGCSESIKSESSQKPPPKKDGKFLSILRLFICFVALRPKSTGMVIAGRSVHLTTLFPGQA